MLEIKNYTTKQSDEYVAAFDEGVSWTLFIIQQFIDQGRDINYIMSQFKILSDNDKNKEKSNG